MAKPLTNEWGEKTVYPETTPGDKLRILPHTKARRFKPQVRLEPTQQHRWQARKVDVLAVIPSGLQLGRAEVLRRLRNLPDKTDCQALIAWGKEGWRKEAGDVLLSEVGYDLCWARPTGTVSRVTLLSLQRDGAGRVWAIPSATMPFPAETRNWSAHKTKHSFQGTWPLSSCRYLV